MTSWAALDEELRYWEAAGRTATLWWRDDDAVADTPALRRLLEVARVPVALAVIPGNLEPSLAPLVAGQADVSILQHGLIHRNHEPPGSKTSELGAARPLGAVEADLKTGWARLQASGFGARLLPVLTPPWNRVAPAAVAALPDWGYRGLSTYGPRHHGPRPDGLHHDGLHGTAQPVPGLIEVNTHVDVIAWRRGRCFVGTEKALGMLIEHLRARRTGAADAAEPTGILTHHLVHDDATWNFLSHLQDWLSDRTVIRWMPTGEVFRRNDIDMNRAGSDRDEE